MNAPIATSPDAGSLLALLPVVVPATAGAGPRELLGQSGDQSQAADFASFISLASGMGLEMPGLPRVPGIYPALPADGAKAIGTAEAWGPPPLLRWLVPGGRVSPPSGTPLPPGLPQPAGGTALADSNRAGVIAALTGSHAAMTSATPAGPPDALSPFLAAVANAGAMPAPWLRSLLAGDRSTPGSDPFLVESADAVMAGDTSLAPAIGTRVGSPPTTIALPTTAAQQPAFEQALGERLARLVQEGRHDARVKRHPAELGSIDIRLSVDGDSTRISLVSPNAAVRDALEHAVPRLRELLGSAGLDLTHVNVGTGDARSHGEFGRPASEPSTGHNPFVRPDEPEASAMTLAIRLPQGLVDTFA